MCLYLDGYLTRNKYIINNLSYFKKMFSTKKAIMDLDAIKEQILTIVGGRDIVESVMLKDQDITIILDQLKGANSSDLAAIQQNFPHAKIIITGKKEFAPKEFAPKEFDRPKPPSPKAIAGISNIIAVASGKGGVGKSTIAANLAIYLAQKGLRVGIVDADIHGPSIPKLYAISGEPEVAHARMEPHFKYGVKSISMGYLLPEGTAAIWRGPMIAKSLQQMFLTVNWGELDYLVVDMPPGTGDIHLSLAQNFLITGAVIVTTPQQISLIDVEKAIYMFKKTGIKILGLIQNMAYMEAASEKIYPFGKGDIENFCQKMGIDYIGDVALNSAISKFSDEGVPAILSDQNLFPFANIRDI